MERLGLLSKEERKLIDDCGVAQDYLGIDFWSKSSEEFRFKFKDNPKLALFVQCLSEQGRYWDLHSGNIMMDMDGNYKVVDLEGFLNTPLELPENNWIIR